MCVKKWCYYYLSKRASHLSHSCMSTWKLFGVDDGSLIMCSWNHQPISKNYSCLSLSFPVLFYNPSNISPSGWHQRKRVYFSCAQFALAAAVSPAPERYREHTSKWQASNQKKVVAEKKVIERTKENVLEIKWEVVAGAQGIWDLAVIEWLWYIEKVNWVS